MLEKTLSRKEVGFIMLMINSFIYISVSVYAPFISAYYMKSGISAMKIGTLLAVGPLVSIFIQPIWAVISDQSGRRKLVLASVALGSAVASIIYYVASNFWFFMMATTIYMAFSTSLVPLSDAIIIEQAKIYRIDFAKVRMGGTVGYAVVAFIAGFYLEDHPSAQFIMACVSYTTLFLFIMKLPSSISKSQDKKKKTGVAGLKGIFITREVFFVFALAFINYVGLSFTSGFLGVYVIELGYNQRLIGGLNFVSAMSEIPILLCIRNIMKRFGAVNTLKYSCIMMAMRILLASRGTILSFLLSQGMQCVTYMTVYYSCAIYISENVMPDRRSQGQSVLTILQAGLGAILGNVLGGYIVDSIGIASAYRIMACFILGLSLFVILLHRIYCSRRKEPAR